MQNNNHQRDHYNSFDIRQKQQSQTSSLRQSQEEQSIQEFQAQKFLMMQQLEKLEFMDKLAPLDNQNFQKYKQQEARRVNQDVTKRISQIHRLDLMGTNFNEEKQKLVNLDHEKMDSKQNQGRHGLSTLIQDQEDSIDRDHRSTINILPVKNLSKDKILKLFQPMVQNIVDLIIKGPLDGSTLEYMRSEDILDFDAKDFEFLEKTVKIQAKLALEDITDAKEDEKNNQLFEGALKTKWDIVRRNFLDRLNDCMMMQNYMEQAAGQRLQSRELKQQKNSNKQQISRMSKLRRVVLLSSQVCVFLYFNQSLQLDSQILPESRFKNIWSYVLSFLCVYTAIVTPVRITFVDFVDTNWIVVDSFINFLLFMDILITLNSAFYDEQGLLVTNRVQIIKNYLFSWFILDVFSVFPFELTWGNGFDGQNNQSYSGYFRLTRLPRMYRIIQMAKIGRNVKEIKKKQVSEMIQDLLQVNSAVMRVLKFLLTVLICVHITACFWYFSAKLNDFGPNTWVYENNLEGSSYWMLYLISFYWAVSTISTVGFGDIHAYNEMEMILSILWMIFGVGFYSFTVSSLSTLFGQLDTRQSHLQNKITFMDEFCAETHLTKSMKVRIRKVLEYNSLVNVFCQNERDDILLDIPTHLQNEIAEAMYSGLKSKLNFFAEKDQVFLSTFIPKLQPLKIGLGEFIYQKGEYPHQVYFIVNGRVNMVVGVHAVTFKTYVTGSYFGEIEIFDNSSRLHSARAEVECDLLGIDYDVFRKILQGYPEYLEEVQMTSLEKMRRERDSLQKLQELTGLPHHSQFFRKRRAQSMYKSIRQRKPVELIQIEEEKSFQDQFQQSGSRSNTRARTEMNIDLDSRIKSRRRSFSAKNAEKVKRRRTSIREMPNEMTINIMSPSLTPTQLIEASDYNGYLLGSHKVQQDSRSPKRQSPKRQNHSRSPQRQQESRSSKRQESKSPKRQQQAITQQVKQNHKTQRLQFFTNEPEIFQIKRSASKISSPGKVSSPGSSQKKQGEQSRSLNDLQDTLETILQQLKARKTKTLKKIEITKTQPQGLFFRHPSLENESPSELSI